MPQYRSCGRNGGFECAVKAFCIPVSICRYGGSIRETSSTTLYDYKRMMDYLFDENSHLLADLSQPWLSRDRLRHFTTTIHNKGAPLENVWGFIHYKSLFHENPMKMRWKTLELFSHGHENCDFGFHGANLHHKISMKLFTSYFHEPWKVYKGMNMDFYGSWKSHILDRYISWPLKRQLQPSMYFMGDEISNSPRNSHEGTIKNPWKCPTHSSTKVDINALEKCCTHLLIRNSSCQICLNLGQ